MEIKFTGWKAIIAIGLIIGFGVFRYTAQTKAMETQGVEAIQKWLFFESARAIQPKMEEALKNPEQNREFLEQSAVNLQQNNFIISSVKRHGTGEHVVARITVNDETGTQVRYLRMSYSMITGWVVGVETTAWVYQLALF